MKKIIFFSIVLFVIILYLFLYKVPSIETFSKLDNIFKIGFHTDQMSERGTEIALYDYAYYNQLFYNNKSIIFYPKNSGLNNLEVIHKFEKQFKCYAYNHFDEVNQIIEKENIKYLYSIIHGAPKHSKLANKCKNLLHAVFYIEPHGDKYASISEYLSKKHNGQADVVPHMINLPFVEGNLRNKFNIPQDVIVLGRYGGLNQFDIIHTHQAIIDILEIDKNIYFLFANTAIFHKHPRIIYIDKIIDNEEKVKFINSCDAMIHGRSDGETFGLAIGEFSSLNKPIITCSAMDNSHIEILGDKGIYYDSYESLLNILKNIRTIIKSKSDWNAYKNYKPKIVMTKFMKIFDIPHNEKKILFTKFWPNHTIDDDHIYLNALKENNYVVDKSDVISDEILSNCDIIICGSFLFNKEDLIILAKYLDKVIFNITEPIEFSNLMMNKLYTKNIFKLTTGCISEGYNKVKYPHYMDWGLTHSNMNEINDYVKHIKLKDIINKKFCCLINRHDNGQTRTNIYNKLKHLGEIICPSTLFNNYPNDEFEKIGRTNFQKQFLFTICPENYVTKNTGYVTEKIFMACHAGTIPIYYGQLDSIDKSIFNINRIIMYNPTSETSINDAHDKVQELITNSTKLFEFYTQPIFNDTAIKTYDLIKENYSVRINNFINEQKHNYSLLTNAEYKNNQENKLNGIDHIVWINLERADDRRISMLKILSTININNTRIHAVDGKNDDITNYTNLKQPMENNIKACSLSHIKAVSYLKNIPGDYFLVLEDDVNFNNLKFFTDDLETIIKQAPEFDILLIHKIFTESLNEKYTKWKPEIFSTAAYIISKQGIYKLLKKAEYDFATKKFNIISLLSYADFYMYDGLNTLVYKYNFISTNDETSTLHADHLNFHRYSSYVQLETILNDLVLNI